MPKTIPTRIVIPCCMICEELHGEGCEVQYVHYQWDDERCTHEGYICVGCQAEAPSHGCTILEVLHVYPTA